jgi:hypothetical protein
MALRAMNVESLLLWESAAADRDRSWLEATPTEKSTSFHIGWFHAPFNYVL